MSSRSVARHSGSPDVARINHPRSFLHRALGFICLINTSLFTCHTRTRHESIVPSSTIVQLALGGLQLPHPRYRHRKTHGNILIVNMISFLLISENRYDKVMSEYHEARAFSLRCFIPHTFQFSDYLFDEVRYCCRITSFCLPYEHLALPTLQLPCRITKLSGFLYLPGRFRSTYRSSLYLCGRESPISLLLRERYDLVVCFTASTLMTCSDLAVHLKDTVVLYLIEVEYYIYYVAPPWTDSPHHCQITTTRENSVF